LAIVIDANIAHKIKPERDDFPILIERLFDKTSIKIGLCRDLREELFNAGYRSTIALLDRVGQIRYLSPDEEIKMPDEKEKIMPIASDDPHIIAMMRIAGFRLIVTDDGTAKGKKLINDVNNQRLLSNPRGKVYNENNRRAAETLLRDIGSLGD